MNIHHLELFYYVAKHGGIMEAVRRIPYGIQQPAVSGQIIQLEDNLGVKLFQRRPFALSPQGHRLFDSIRPFFDDIEGICDQIRDGTSELIRLGAPTMVLDRYFPDIIRSLRKSLPGVKLALREGHHHHIQQMLESGQIDLGITPIEGSLPQNFETVSLMEKAFESWKTYSSAMPREGRRPQEATIELKMEAFEEPHGTQSS